MRYGFDYERLWFWPGSASQKTKVANWSVVDSNVDYLRTAITCAYELEEGVYVESAYDKILDMMTYMKNAKPDIKFFATPRPYNDAVPDGPWCPYPLWINVFTPGPNGSWTFVEFKWQKCAQYLIRYVQFMNAHGFKIHYIDLTNEFNNITPAHMLNIKNTMAAALGDQMPLIVAPSTWSFTQGVTWLNSAISQGAVDAIDIPASHNTGNQGTPSDFSSKAFSMGFTEVWDSEMHGWVGESPAEEIPTCNVLWDRVRAGFSGIDSWLAIGTTAQGHCMILNSGSCSRNVKYFIFQKVTNTSNYGYYLNVNQPSEFTSTAAFIKDNKMTVWVLNNSSTDVSGINFTVTDRKILDTSIERTRWNGSIAIAGVVDSTARTSYTTFSSGILANSLYCFNFTVEDTGVELDLEAHYKFDGDTLDSSGYGHNATLYNSSETYSPGQLGQALEFDGVNDYAKVPYFKGVLGAADRTCAAWIKTSAAAGPERPVVAWGIGTIGNRWCFRLKEDATFGASVYGGNISTRRTYNDDQWHHVAATLSSDGSPRLADIRLYVDGSLETNPTITNDPAINTASAGDVVIGSRQEGTPYSYFNGLIDDLQIYDYALSNYNIAGLYFAGVPEGSVCLQEENYLIYDYDKNCVVDLSDLLQFAYAWLSSTYLDQFGAFSSEWLDDSSITLGDL